MDTTVLHHYVEMGLTWVGFGVVCGLAAKLLMPGRDPGGTLVTFLLGIGGALIGASTYAWAVGHRIRDLISPLGFTVAIAGAFLLLLSHRLLSGRLFGNQYVTDEVIIPEPRLARRRRRMPKFSDLD